MLVATALGTRARSHAAAPAQPGARPNGAPAGLANLAPPRPNEPVLLRMQRDLQRALQKPVEQRRWAMVIDLRKYIGCSACTIACKAENRLPPGVVYRPVL